MTSTRRSMARLLSACLLAAPLSVAYAADQNATPAPAGHRKSHKKPAPFVLPPLPSGPLRQVPMDQLPAAAPTVTYQDGLLTIGAQNATLDEILSAVRKLTGASIDIPQGGASGRVVTQLGPGAPRDVLAQLLNGTSFNYVMVGSTSDPNAVASVTLSPKPSSGEVQTAANTPPTTFQPVLPVMPGGVMPPQPFRQQMITPGAQPQPVPAAAADAEDKEEDADADDKDDESDQAQPGQPGTPNGSIPQPNGQAADPNQPNAGPKSPEQILQMMRQGQPGVPPNGPLNGPPPQE